MITVVVPFDGSNADLENRLVDAGWRVRRESEETCVAVRGRAFSFNPLPGAKAPQRMVLNRLTNGEMSIDWSVGTHDAAITFSRAAVAEKLFEPISEVFPEFVDCLLPQWTGKPLRHFIRLTSDRWSIVRSLPQSIYLLLFSYMLAWLAGSYLIWGVNMRDSAGTGEARRDILMFYVGPGGSGKVKPGNTAVSTGTLRFNSLPDRTVYNVLVAGPASVIIENGRVIVDGKLRPDLAQVGSAGSSADFDVPKGYFMVTRTGYRDSYPTSIKASDLSGQLIWKLKLPDAVSNALVK